MKVKGLILSLALLLGASSVWADDNVSVVKPLAINKGQTKKVAVALENAKAYSAFQMDIQLPDGLTMSNPKSLRTSNKTFHNINFGEVDGITRVVTVSYKVDSDEKTIIDGAKNFIDGKSEIILFFDVTASDAYAGGNIEVKNVKFVSTEGTAQAMADASSENGLILGDANGDTKVDTKDAIKLVEQYLGKNPSSFNTKAADITLDGTFDTKDAIQIITVYLGK
jgi:hypothetical protein